MAAGRSWLEWLDLLLAGFFRSRPLEEMFIKICLYSSKKRRFSMTCSDEFEHEADRLAFSVPSLSVQALRLSLFLYLKNYCLGHLTNLSKWAFLRPEGEAEVPQIDDFPIGKKKA